MSDTNESSTPADLRASVSASAPTGAPTLFRSTALAKLDVAAEIDNQLPLVPRRTWLIAVGAILLVIAFGMWAAITPSVTSVSGVISPSQALLLTKILIGVVAGLALVRALLQLYSG